MIDRHRKLGFAFCFAISLAVFWVSWQMIGDMVKGPHAVRVHFPNVGTLILQEPVSMDGVEIGRVSAINYRKGAAEVVLEFYKRIELPADSRIINFNHSMMGSRMIFVERGNSSRNMNMDEVQQGIFEPGIGEMLHRADTLLVLVEHYQNLVNELYAGSEERPSLLQYQNEIMEPILRQLSAFTVSMNKDLEGVDRRMENLNRYTEDGLKLVRRFRKQSLKLAGTVDSLTALADSGLKTVNVLLNEVDSLMTRARDPEAFFYRLVYEREMFGRMEQVNESLNNLVSLLRAEGLSDIISFWRNVHIWGSNPTRKNRRAL